MKELAALTRVSAREKLAAKRRAKQQAKLSAKQKEKNTEMLVGKRILFLLVLLLYCSESGDPEITKPSCCAN